MKKLRIVALILTIVTFCVPAISIDAIQITPTEETQNPSTTVADRYINVLNYDTFAESYFEHLKENFGINHHGSCGYVALGMLLSYYDTYWNDSIIPEQYDASSIGNEVDMVLRENSPGIVADKLYAPETTNSDANGIYSFNYGESLSSQDYIEKMVLMSDECLHSKLITISNALGYYNQANRGDYCSSTLTERIDVLNTYLSDIAGFESSDYTLEYINREYNYNLSNEVREFTIQKVMQGIPVLLAVSDSSVGRGHAMIAYSYDAETDELFCHSGWYQGATKVTAEYLGYDQYCNALVINFAGEHVHSNNYGVTVGEGEDAVTTYYCYCDPTIITYNNHPHSYTYSYEDHSSSQHKSYCECGLSKMEDHTISNGTCSSCQHVHTHSYTNWFKISSTHHRGICLQCDEGAISIAQHVVRVSEIENGIAPCLYCKFFVDVVNYNIPIIQNVSKISINGSYILPNGVIVLVDEDVEAYLNGTLVFYDRDKLPEVQ